MLFKPKKTVPLLISAFFCMQSLSYAAGSNEMEIKSEDFAQTTKALQTLGMPYEEQEIGESEKKENEAYRKNTLHVLGTQTISDGSISCCPYAVFKGGTKGDLYIAKTAQGDYRYSTQKIGELYMDGNEKQSTSITQLNTVGFLVSWIDKDQNACVSRILFDARQIIATKLSIPKALSSVKIKKIKAFSSKALNADVAIQTSAGKVYVINYNIYGSSTLVQVADDAEFIGFGPQQSNKGSSIMLNIAGRLVIYSRNYSTTNYTFTKYLTPAERSIETGQSQINVNSSNEAIVFYTAENTGYVITDPDLDSEALPSESTIPDVEVAKSISSNAMKNFLVVVKNPTSKNSKTYYSFGDNQYLTSKYQDKNPKIPTAVYQTDSQITAESQLNQSDSGMPILIESQTGSTGSDIKTTYEVQPKTQSYYPVILTSAAADKDTGSNKFVATSRNDITAIAYVLSWEEGGATHQRLLFSSEAPNNNFNLVTIFTTRQTSM